MLMKIGGMAGNDSIYEMEVQIPTTGYITNVSCMIYLGVANAQPITVTLGRHTNNIVKYTADATTSKSYKRNNFIFETMKAQAIDETDATGLVYHGFSKKWMKVYKGEILKLSIEGVDLSGADIPFLIQGELLPRKNSEIKIHKANLAVADDSENFNNPLIAPFPLKNCYLNLHAIISNDGLTDTRGYVKIKAFRNAPNETTNFSEPANVQGDSFDEDLEISSANEQRFTTIIKEIPFSITPETPAVIDQEIYVGYLRTGDLVAIDVEYTTTGTNPNTDLNMILKGQATYTHKPKIRWFRYTGDGITKMKVL